MKKCEIIIRPDKLEDLKNILDQHNCGGMTVSSVMGCGKQKGVKDTQFYRGLILNINLLPKIQVNVIIEDDILEDLLLDISSKISTGNVGDGKVFVYELFDAMRIRTGERGDKAI